MDLCRPTIVDVTFYVHGDCVIFVYKVNELMNEVSK